MAAPLKLKQQKFTTTSREQVLVAKHLPIASVLVDTPVSHLEGIYDYLVPQHLSDTATVGTKVLIEFGKGRTEGLLLSRKAESEQSARLKPILELASPSGLVSTALIKHIELVRNRFGGSFWSILKSAIPSRVVKEERSLISPPEEIAELTYESPGLRDLIGKSDYSSLEKKDRILWGVNFPITVNPDYFLLELIKVRAMKNQVLILVPDEKDLERLASPLSELFGNDFIEIGSHLNKNLRYRYFLQAAFKSPKVIIATRSGAFTPLLPGATVIVLSDLDQSHYELHAPGWNTRDVSLLRDNQTSLLFVSSSHSLEISRLIDIGWLEKKGYRQNNKIKFITNEMGNSYISAIKKGVTKGSALISVAEKGYANLFLCSKCRNTASCECGGKLQIQESRKVPQCYICQKNYPEWKCNFCSDNRPFVIAKGVERTAEEIGKAVPKFPILISSGSKQIKKLPGGNYIVVATPGSEPNERYSTVVMLDGERIFNRPSLRSEELAKFAWFSLLNMVMPDSEVFVSLPNHHPVVQAMLKMDPSSSASYELSSRRQAKLPPYYRVAVVTGDIPEISKFAENLRSSKNSYEITGPIKIDSYQSKILIRVELEQAQVLVDLLDDITKVQGVKSRKIFTVRFDPFDL